MHCHATFWLVCFFFLLNEQYKTKQWSKCTFLAVDKALNINDNNNYSDKNINKNNNNAF